MTDKTKITINNETKKFRPNVAAIVLSAKYPHTCEIFIASRTDVENAWQFPQGGIDEGETAKEALFRELEEEIGTKEIEIIAEYPRWVSYEFPPAIAKRMYPYDGQRQKYYLVKLKKGARVNINTELCMIPTSPTAKHLSLFSLHFAYCSVRYLRDMCSTCQHTI